MVFIIKRVSDYNFRELNNQYIFVASTVFNELLVESFPMDMEANGFLGYAFIDHEQGMGVEVLCTGNFNAESKALRLEKEDVLSRVTIPMEAIAEMDIIVVPSNAPVLEIFSAKVKLVNLEHACSENVLATRNVVNMDSCRRNYYPDDIYVQLIKGDEQIEQCSVRVEGIEKFSLYGTLLNEPTKEFGVHQGDKISFFNVKNAQGIMCIAVFE